MAAEVDAAWLAAGKPAAGDLLMDILANRGFATSGSLVNGLMDPR